MTDRLRPKKRLGQHFLRSPETAARIAAMTRPQAGEGLLEIGPGEGALTRHLAAAGFPLLCVEFDREACELLRSQSWPGDTRFVEADFLRFPLPDRPLHWVWTGNLPYQITSPVLFRLLEERARVRRAVFMTQREVAQRLASPPGTRNSGVLSVLLGAWYRLEHGFDLSPEAFRPPPKVWSSVIALERRDDPPAVSFSALAAVVKTAYNQRRKQLGNALKSLSLDLPPEIATLRAENLSLDTFVELARQLEKKGILASNSGVD